MVGGGGVLITLRTDAFTNPCHPAPMPAVRTHTYRSLSPAFKLSARCQGSPHLAACMVFIFFLSHSNWNHNSQVLDQMRSEVCLLHHTVSLAHYYSSRCSMPAHTRSGYLFIVFFTESHPHCALACSRIQMWVRNARVVVKWKKKTQHRCETMRSGCIWKLIGPPLRKKCSRGDIM